MPSVAVVTDTTHYAPRSLVAGLGIHEVSLWVGWGDARVRELDVGGWDEFYDRLRTDPELPTTSQPSIGDFLEAWQPLLDAGHDVVSIHLAGGISGTVGAARQACEMLSERGVGRRVAVLDAETGCGGLGYLALAAACRARQGASLEEVVEHVRRARETMRLWFAIDTMEYLARGGRVGRAQAWLGAALRIKPILSLESEITPIQRVRTSARAFDRMAEFLRERQREGSDVWVVQHIQTPDVAERLVEVGRTIFDSEPLFVSEIGPVIGTYTGPGLLGAGGASSRFLPGFADR